MEYKMGYVLGVMCGVLICVIICMFIFKWTHKDKAFKCKFDERQELAIGRGAKYALYTLMSYNVLYAVIDEGIEQKFISNSLALITGLIIAAAVYVGYCIWKEAYFALNENPKRVMIAFAMIAIVNFMSFAMNTTHGNLVKDGVIQLTASNLLCGILFALIFIELILKSISKKREEHA